MARGGYQHWERLSLKGQRARRRQQNNRRAANEAGYKSSPHLCRADDCTALTTKLHCDEHYALAQDGRLPCPVCGEISHLSDSRGSVCRACLERKKTELEARRKHAQEYEGEAPW